ncbi:hypothetical protein [Flavobacterium sp. 245]|uniref:hypothetical protein n=1 Tax=Flavobacterium sp. 245 TaxID=2512115 RepID=UPI00105C5CE5|nr:hypothetical protein [Flavobacterium sp. 245]TDP03094.1 hypothetical protein EV145_102256 [Flavobacterium sp. 245]
MGSNNTNHRNYLSTLQSKDNFFKAQENRYFEYLKTHITTNSMVSNALNTLQKKLTQYKRSLEKLGLHFEVEMKRCKITGFQAWYLSTKKDY